MERLKPRQKEESLELTPAGAKNDSKFVQIEILEQQKQQEITFQQRKSNWFYDVPANHKKLLYARQA